MTTLLEELFERSGGQGPCGLFPGAKMCEIADGTKIIPAIRVKREFLPVEEIERLRQNFEVRIWGNKKQYADIIERPKKQEKQNKPNFLAKIIRMI